MRRVTAIRPPRWQTVAVAAGAALLAAACGSSGTPSSGSSPSTTSAAPSSAAPSSAAPGPTSALCQDAAALRASIDTLTHVQVGQGMGDEIKSDLADVKAKLNTLTTQAHGQWQSQTSCPVGLARQAPDRGIEPDLQPQRQHRVRDGDRAPRGFRRGGQPALRDRHEVPVRIRFRLTRHVAAVAAEPAPERFARHRPAQFRDRRGSANAGAVPSAALATAGRHGSLTPMG